MKLTDTHQNNSYISKLMSNIILNCFLSFTFAWIIALGTVAYSSVFSAAEQVDVSYSEITPECSE